MIKNKVLRDELKGAALGLLQEATLREDIVLLIVKDPQQHVVKWLHDIDKNTVILQERIIKIVSCLYVFVNVIHINIQGFQYLASTCKHAWES